MKRYVLHKFLLGYNGKGEYKNIKVNGKYWFEANNDAEAIEIAQQSVNKTYGDTSGSYQIRRRNAEGKFIRI